MRRSKRGGRSVYAEVGFWQEGSGAIHLTIGDVTNGHVSISNDPTKQSGHPQLFRRLAKALKDMGAPSPE